MADSATDYENLDEVLRGQISNLLTTDYGDSFTSFNEYRENGSYVVKSGMTDSPEYTIEQSALKSKNSYFMFVSSIGSESDENARQICQLVIGISNTPTMYYRICYYNSASETYDWLDWYDCTSKEVDTKSTTTQDVIVTKSNVTAPLSLLATNNNFNLWFTRINEMIEYINENYADLYTLQVNEYNELKRGQISNLLDSSYGENLKSFNNFTECGTYYVNSGLINSPEFDFTDKTSTSAKKYFLKVTSYGSENDSNIREIWQFALDLTYDNSTDKEFTHHYYYRVCYYDKSNVTYSWNAWKKIISAEEIESLYIKRTSANQTINGNLTVTENITSNSTISGKNILATESFALGSTINDINTLIASSNSDLHTTITSRYVSSNSNYDFVDTTNDVIDSLDNPIGKSIDIDLQTGFTTIYGRTTYADYLNNLGIWKGTSVDVDTYIQTSSKNDIEYYWEKVDIPSSLKKAVKNIEARAVSVGALFNYDNNIKNTYFKKSGGGIYGSTELMGSDLIFASNVYGKYGSIRVNSDFDIHTHHGLNITSSTSWNSLFLDRPNEPISHNEFDQVCVFGSRTRTSDTNRQYSDGAVVHTLGSVELGENKTTFRIRNKSSAGNNVSPFLPSRFLRYERIVDDNNKETNLFFRPSTDVGTGKTSLGSSAFKFEDLYLKSNSIISVADEKDIEKYTSEEEQNDTELSTIIKNWGNVNWFPFRFTEDVESKGVNARIHAGTSVQNIANAVYGTDDLDTVNEISNSEKISKLSKFGMYCYDKWDDTYDDENVEIYVNDLDVTGKLQLNDTYSVDENTSIVISEKSRKISVTEENGTVVTFNIKTDNDRIILDDNYSNTATAKDDSIVVRNFDFVYNDISENSCVITISGGPKNVSLIAKFIKDSSSDENDFVVENNDTSQDIKIIVDKESYYVTIVDKDNNTISFGLTTDRDNNIIIDSNIPKNCTDSLGNDISSNKDICLSSGVYELINASGTNTSYKKITISNITSTDIGFYITDDILSILAKNNSFYKLDLNETFVVDELNLLITGKSKTVHFKDNLLGNSYSFNVKTDGSSISIDDNYQKLVTDSKNNALERYFSVSYPSEENKNICIITISNVSNNIKILVTYENDIFTFESNSTEQNLTFIDDGKNSYYVTINDKVNNTIKFGITSTDSNIIKLDTNITKEYKDKLGNTINLYASYVSVSEDVYSIEDSKNKSLYYKNVIITNLTSNTEKVVINGFIANDEFTIIDENNNVVQILKSEVTPLYDKSTGNRIYGLTEIQDTDENKHSYGIIGYKEDDNGIYLKNPTNSNYIPIYGYDYQNNPIIAVEKDTHYGIIEYKASGNVQYLYQYNTAIGNKIDAVYCVDYNGNNISKTSLASDNKTTEYTFFGYNVSNNYNSLIIEYKYYEVNKEVVPVYAFKSEESEEDDNKVIINPVETVSSVSKSLIKKKGNSQMLRYQEVQAFENIYLRTKMNECLNAVETIDDKIKEQVTEDNILSIITKKLYNTDTCEDDEYIIGKQEDGTINSLSKNGSTFFSVKEESTIYVPLSHVNGFNITIKNICDDDEENHEEGYNGPYMYVCGGTKENPVEIDGSLDPIKLSHYEYVNLMEYNNKFYINGTNNKQYGYIIC